MWQKAVKYYDSRVKKLSFIFILYGIGNNIA